MTTIISLGGSLIVPDEIDIDFLKSFKEAIIQIARKEKIVIICGGGRICRKYQQAASRLSLLSVDDLDWVGIKATHLNAELVRVTLGKIAAKEAYSKPVKPKSKITVAGGWLPGCSTDYDAVLWAKKSGAKKIINMSNVDYLYNKDPNKFPEAKKIKEMRWKDYRKISGNKWIPGLHLPFDPVASKEAEKMKLKVYIIGKDIMNLKNLLSGKKFKGSVIG